MTQVPECTRKHVPLFSTDPHGQQYYTTFRAATADGLCQEVAGPPLRPDLNLYASKRFKNRGHAHTAAPMASLFRPNTPMRKLVDHLTRVHCGQDWRLTITPAHSEWTKHHLLPATHQDDLTFLDSFSITLERRYSMAGLPSLDLHWSGVYSNFDAAPTKTHIEKLNEMGAKHARVKKRALHSSNDEAAHKSYWDKRIVTVSTPPYTPPAKLCDSTTGEPLRAVGDATTNTQELLIQPKQSGYEERFNAFHDDQPVAPGLSAAEQPEFNRTGVAVNQRTYGDGGGNCDVSAIHLPVMETTAPVSEITLQVDFYKMLLESSAASKTTAVASVFKAACANETRVITRVARAIYTGKSSDYILWRSMPELRSAIAETASKDKFAAQCLMARIGGFHVPAAMAALRERVGGDSTEFGTHLTLEYLNSELYVSLKYLPGTEPIEWPDSDDEAEEDDEGTGKREPLSEIGSELL